jgi:hypothetical protein
MCCTSVRRHLCGRVFRRRHQRGAAAVGHGGERHHRRHRVRPRRQVRSLLSANLVKAMLPYIVSQLACSPGLELSAANTLTAAVGSHQIALHAARKTSSILLRCATRGC